VNSDTEVNTEYVAERVSLCVVGELSACQSNRRVTAGSLTGRRADRIEKSTRTYGAYQTRHIFAMY